MAPPPASRPPTPTATAASSSRIDSPSLKAALAMALIHYNRLPGKAAAAVTSSARTSSPPLNHWKRKAKDRKREILRLREELNSSKMGSTGKRWSRRSHHAGATLLRGRGPADGAWRQWSGALGRRGAEEEVPQAGYGFVLDWVGRACYLNFVGVSSGMLQFGFAATVRWKEKRQRVEQSSNLIDFNSEDEMQQLSMSTDYLVELSDAIFTKMETGLSFATFSHQAVDFILASLKNILSSEREKELIEDIINELPV